MTEAAGFTQVAISVGAGVATAIIAVIGYFRKGAGRKQSTEMVAVYGEHFSRVHDALRGMSSAIFELNECLKGLIQRTDEFQHRYEIDKAYERGKNEAGDRQPGRTVPERRRLGDDT